MKKPMLTVGSDRLPPSVRQNGGEILIGKDKFYAVPLTAQRAVKFDGSTPGQGVKRTAESVAGPVRFAIKLRNGLNFD